MQRTAYADNAATMPLSKKALDSMMPYLTGEFGNPSTIYSFGRSAKQALESARVMVAKSIGALPGEIYFTSGGTEADNWAIRAAMERGNKKGKHIIASSVEHHAVLHTLQHLERQGCRVTYLNVNEYGQISLPQLQKAICEDTVLITVMAANNEIGTVYPIDRVAAIAREHGVLFHTDAVQAVGHIPIDVSKMNIDLLSLAGHKFGGPKGVGALYINKKIKLPSYLYGGGQERGLRSGTENVAGIVGLGAALEQATAHMQENSVKVSAMRDRLIDGLLKIPRSRLTGEAANRLPGNASFVFECVEGEAMVLLLDQEGICASSGSACSSGSLDPSHVLMAIGLPHEIAHGSLRLSLSENNTDADIDYILEKLPAVINRLRDMSPLWEEVSQEK